MLEAVRQHFAESRPDALVTDKSISDHWSGVRSTVKRRFSVPLPGSLHRLAMLLPLASRRKMNLVFDHEVDVILDASGFAYGDQWGVKKLDARLGRNIAAWKQQGKKVVVLPQAFGPFTDPGFAPLLKHIVEHADLVFARDSESYQHIVAITGERPNVVQKPDFTNLVTTKDAGADLGQVVVIPNSKMLEMNKGETIDNYVKVLVRAINLAQAHGKRVYLLNHEGPKDRNIIDQINRALEQPLEVFESDDPVAIKAAIRNTEITISSRFHGLVSALSQGVPVVATGWSHKYQELLGEYSVADYLISVDEAAMERVLLPLLDDEYRKTVSARIVERSDVLKAETKDMWRRVDALVGAPHPDAVLVGA